jgi:hypothetical protein
MNKVTKEPSLKVKKKALFSEKMNRYFWIFLLLLVTETVIALFHFHKFIRGFIGDVLVIPLLFYFGKWITRFSAKRILLLVILVAFSIECMQLLNLASKLGIENSVFYILLGNTFDPWDLVAYLIGGLTVIIFERYFS